MVIDHFTSPAKKKHTLSMNVDNPFMLYIPSHAFDLLIPSNYFGYPEVKYDAAQLDVPSGYVKITMENHLIFNGKISINGHF